MAASAPSQYLLRWNDHLSNYGDIFLTLREQEEFVDCSIACEDGIVGAHRVVLAGCSSYLRDLFARVANPHPVIFLLNTSRSLVLMLMEFIYRGQVHVPQHRLQQLVVLGQALKIKGLTQIMVPVARVSSDTGSPRSSITPLAFPHGLPLSTTSSLPFTAISNNINNLDVSVLSCENEKTILEENENSREDHLMEEEEEEEEEEENNEQEREHTSPEPKKRKRRIKRRCYAEKPEEHNETLLQDKKLPLKLYTNVKERSLLGAYALQHGIDATRRYILENHRIKMRESTIERLIMFHKKYQAKKNGKRKLKKAKWQAIQE